MARFPNRESDILVLAQDVITGFTAHPETFPNPPISLAQVAEVLATYIKSRDAAIDAQAAAMACVANKQKALDTLIADIKALLRYAETVAPTELTKVGWAGRRPASPVQAPSPPRLLESLEHGNGAIDMDWKSGREGGRPEYYEVQRRDLPQGDWQHVATALHAEISLDNQPRNISLEYRVLAVNKTATSPASNTLSVSL